MKKHNSVNWSKRLSIVVKETFKNEYFLHTNFEPYFVNKIGATILGQDLSHYDDSFIYHSEILKICDALLEKAKKQNAEIRAVYEENYKYRLRSSHEWGLKSYDYKIRLVEENLQDLYNFHTTTDTIVLGEYNCVMLVKRILENKSIAA